MLQPSTTIRRSPRAVFRKLGDGAGAVLLHLDTAAYHSLNEIGALIWTLVNEGTTFDELITGLKKRLNGAPPTLEVEVSDFLRQLGERDLVEFESSAGGR